MLVAVMLGDVEFGQNAGEAAHSHPPQLIASQPLVYPADYPSMAIRRQEQGVVSVLLRVADNGTVTSCTVTESAKSKHLDMKTCEVLTSRAKFKSATNASGEPVAGDFRHAIDWSLEGKTASVVKLDLRASTIPSSYKSPVTAKLMLGATGRVSDCEVDKSSGSDAADRAACAFARREVAIPLPRAATAGIEPMGVRFLVANLVVDPGAPPSVRN